MMEGLTVILLNEKELRLTHQALSALAPLFTLLFQITAHDLLNAMNFLPGPSAPAQPVSAPAQSAAASGADPLLPKLNALAELGFTDEAAARRALEAADGDVEMAVDLLLS